MFRILETEGMRNFVLLEKVSSISLILESPFPFPDLLITIIGFMISFCLNINVRFGKIGTFFMLEIIIVSPR